MSLVPSVPKRVERAASMPWFERGALLLYAALVGLWVLDANLADTVLTAPIDGSFLTFTRITGAAVGGLLGLVLARWMMREQSGWDTFRRVFVVLATIASSSALYSVIGDHAAERLANMYSFWDSEAPVSPASFPIVSHSCRGKGGPAADIGASRSIPISEADCALLDEAGASQRYCLSLMRQQQGDAVRVYLSSAPHAGHHRKRITIEICRTSVS